MKKVFKLIMIAAGITVLLAALLHFYFVYRSKNLLQYIVSQASNGTYQAEAKKVRFSYWPASLTVTHLTVKPNNKAPQPPWFLIKSDSIHLQLKSIANLIFYKRLQVEDLIFVNPTLYATPAPDADTAKPQNINETLQEIETGLLNTFSLLKVQKANIVDGAAMVTNPADSNRSFSLNHIYLQLMDIDIRPDAQKNDSLVFNGKINLRLVQPDIRFMNNQVKVRLGHLQTIENGESLEIDSLKLSIQKSALHTDSVQLATIRIQGFNWHGFLQKNLIELDSVIIAEGIASIDMRDKQLSKQNLKQQTIRYRGLDFWLHQLDIKNIYYKLQTTEPIKGQLQTGNYQWQGNALLAREVKLTKTASPPFSLQEMLVALTNANHAQGQSNNGSTLGSMLLTQNAMLLTNYQYKNQNRALQKVIVPKLMLKGYSLPNLLAQRLVADTLVIEQPSITFLHRPAINPPKKGLKVNQVIDGLQSLLDNKLDIETIQLNNTQINVNTSTKAGRALHIRGLDIEINGSELAGAQTVPQLLQSIKHLNGQALSMEGPGVQLKLEQVHLLQQPMGVTIGRLYGKAGPYLHLNLYGLKILASFDQFTHPNQSLALNLFSADSGQIQWLQQAPAATPSHGSTMHTWPEILIQQLNLAHVQIAITTPLGAARLPMAQVQAQQLKWVNNQAHWQHLSLQSTNPWLQQQKLTLQATALQLQLPGQLYLMAPHITASLPQHQMAIQAKAMAVGSNLQLLATPTIHLTHCEVQSPVIQLMAHKPLQSPQPCTPNSQATNPTPVTIASIHITNPQLEYLASHDSVLQYFQHWGGYIKLQQLEWHTPHKPSRFFINQAWLVADSVKAQTRWGMLAPLQTQIHLGQLENTARGTWQGHIYRASTSKLVHPLLLGPADTLQITAEDGVVEQLAFSTADTVRISQWLHSPATQLKGLHLSYNNPTHQLLVRDVWLTGGTSLNAGWGTLSYGPRLERQQYWAAQDFQKDFIALNTDSGRVTGLQLEESNPKPALQVQTAQIWNAELTAARNKQMPNDTVSYKPLLAQSLQQIGIAFALDTLALHQAAVTYQEVHAKTGMQGSLHFTQANGLITGLKNYNFNPDDSLNLKLRATLQHQTQLIHQFKQSYADSLQGFWMQSRAGALKLPQLNDELLVPLLGIKIKRGLADSLFMRVTGNSLMAFGYMDFRYRQLQVQLLKDHRKEKFFLSGIINWLANQLVRSSSNQRPNLLYKQRPQDKGTFAFWGKIATEGLLTNFGLKKDQKELRQFKKQLRRQHLPQNMWQDADN